MYLKLKSSIVMVKSLFFVQIKNKTRIYGGIYGQELNIINKLN